MHSSRRRTLGVTWAILLVAFLIVLAGCGDVYRPVAIPITAPGGDPQTTHFAVVASKGDLTAIPPDTGKAGVFDVSGDTNMGNRVTGVNPVAVAVDANLSFAWVVNQGTAGQDDSTVTRFSPAVSGASTSTVNLETGAGANAVYAVPLFAFVTEGALNKVAVISTAASAVKAFVPVGNNPVAVTATSNGAKAYVVNKNDSTVTVVSSADSTVLGAPIAVGATPVDATIQTDSAYVYVASQGGNSLSVISTSTDSEVQRVTGLSGPTHVVWDDHLKRVYVVNGGGNTISVFNASTPGSLTLLKTVNTSATPIGIAVLDNGVKFYVLYAGAPGKVDVFDAQSYNLRTTVTVQNNPVSIAAAPESSKVYVVNSTGDGGATFPNGSISIIKTSDDSVLNVAPPSANPFYVTIQ
ncbi:MAG TPA: YncE family protein [Terriglobales bacterium]|nr:YncE family protein [Terriglobales bacterium]